MWTHQVLKVIDQLIKHTISTFSIFTTLTLDSSRPVQDTFRKVSRYKYSLRKKYLDTDTFEILSEKVSRYGYKILDTDTFKILYEKSI